MKKYLLLSLAFLLILVGCFQGVDTQSKQSELKQEQQDELEMKTAGGEEVNQVEATNSDNTEAKSVIAGTVAVANILNMLEYDNVVGVPSTEYEVPERYKEAKEIGQPMQPDMEKIKILEADLFISVATLQAANEKKLQDIGVDYLFIETDSYDTMLNSITELGNLLGREEQAEKYITDVKSKVAEITELAKDKKSPTILFLFGSPKSIMIGTENSFVGSLIKELGFHNVANDIGDFDDSYVPLSIEEVIKANPDIILRMTHVKPEVAKKMFEKEFSENEIWNNMDAVKNGKTYDLPNNIFTVSGNIFIPEALEELNNIVYE